jgi:hypothetical protein
MRVPDIAVPGAGQHVGSQSVRRGGQVGLPVRQSRAAPQFSPIVEPIRIGDGQIRFMVTFLRGGLALPVALLGACALQPDYRRPALDAPASWSNAPDRTARSQAATPIDKPWWSQLNDAAIDRLVAAGLRDNPTLAEAAARVDQARASLTVRDAAKLPTVGIEGSTTRSRDRLNPTGGGGSAKARMPRGFGSARAPPTRKPPVWR